MSVNILTGEAYQCLYCSTTDVAFGPLFTPDDDVLGFLQWLPEDARTYSDSDLKNKMIVWQKIPSCDYCYKKTEDKLQRIVMDKFDESSELDSEDARTYDCCIDCFDSIHEEYHAEDFSVI